MSPAAAPSLLTPLLAFAAILIAIPLLLWLLKRSPMAARLGGLGAGLPAAPARLVATLALGPQQRVVTLEVGQGAQRRWLLVGVTPQGMHTLHTLELPPAADTGAAPAELAPTAAPPVFASLLGALRPPR